MAETVMPAAEATAIALESEEETSSYEFAFHILPTVAEEEVQSVFEALKGHITKAGGELFDEEVPEHTPLAYDIVKQIDGKNLKFHSAYFGWLRFRILGEKLASLTESIDAELELLRYLIIKLTRAEEQHPFRFHEARKAQKVEEVEEREVLSGKEEKEERAEVSEEKLDESLGRIAEGADVSEEETKDVEKT